MGDNDIVVDKMSLGPIPAIACYQRNAAHAPLIIFSHGFTGNKEDGGEEMTLYAGKGFFTVSIDNRGHGERKDEPFFSQVMENGKLDVLKVRKLINQTAEDIPVVIDHFENDDRVAPGRAGMLGVSMGGFITFKALALDDRIRAAAPIIASPVWDEFPKDTPLVDTPELRGRLKAYAEEHGPTRFLERFFDRDILVHIGTADRHFAPAGVRSFVEKVNASGRGRIRLLEYPGVAHEVTAEMRRKTLAWMIEKLIDPGGERTERHRK